MISFAVFKQDSVSEVPPKSDDLSVESEDELLDCGLEDADDPEQLAVQNLTSRHQQSVPSRADPILQKDAADEQSNKQSGLEPRQDCNGIISETQPGAYSLGPFLDLMACLWWCAPYQGTPFSESESQSNH